MLDFKRRFLKSNGKCQTKLLIYSGKPLFLSDDLVSALVLKPFEHQLLE